MLGEFWAQHKGRGFHKADKSQWPQILSDDRVLTWTRADARLNVGFYDDEDQHRLLHRNLFPQPFIGNLDTAKVFILYGNPGFALTDYEDEWGNRLYQDVCRRNLRGEGVGFYPLLPEAVGTGAGCYWRPRLYPLIVKLRSLLAERDLPKVDAIQLAVKKVALIEASAYHSKSSPGRWVRKLRSSEIARRYVSEVLVPRARRGEIMIFVWRGLADWGVTRGKNILLRERNARLSYLTKAERDRIAKYIVSEFVNKRHNSGRANH